MNDFGPGFAIPLFAAVAGLVFILRGPIGQALARRLEGRGAEASDRNLQAEIDDLKARIAESEELRVHIAELEERLDFAERLLARKGGARQLSE